MSTALDKIAGREDEFARIWNDTSVAKTAEYFGLARVQASDVASLLRKQGVALANRRQNYDKVSLSPDMQVRLWDAMEKLCEWFGSCPDDVMKFERCADARHSVRRALAWAAHYHVPLSLKQVGKFFRNRSHPTICWWCNEATGVEQAAGLRALGIEVPE